MHKNTMVMGEMCSLTLHRNLTFGHHWDTLAKKSINLSCLSRHAFFKVRNMEGFSNLNVV